MKKTIREKLEDLKAEFRRGFECEHLVGNFVPVKAGIDFTNEVTRILEENTESRRHWEVAYFQHGEIYTLSVAWIEDNTLQMTQFIKRRYAKSWQK